MNYCVIKNTTTVVDGSDNLLEVMLKNAINAGFSETEVEILTEEEYQARKALEPIEPNPPTVEEQLAEANQKISIQAEQIAELNLQDIFQMELLIERGLV